MKAICPACLSAIPAQNIALEAGWGKCGFCNEVFPLADVVEGFSSAEDTRQELLERPYDALAIVKREEDSLTVQLPPRGMTSSAWTFLSLTVVWFAFFGFLTMKTWSEENGASLFFVPFYLMGVGLLGGVLWSARSRRTLIIDSKHMATEVDFQFWRRRKRVDRALVQTARVGDVPWRQESPSQMWQHYAAEIVYEKGTFRLPCDTTAERDWLIAEINDFLQRDTARGRST